MITINANIITVNNHTKYPVYAAVYYVGTNWLNQSVGPAARYGQQICIEPEKSAQLERPRLYPMYHREVLFSILSTDLTENIGCEQYSDTPRHSIGWHFDTVYHVAELNDRLTCYDSIGYALIRPALEEYNFLIEALIVRLRAQYSDHPYSKSTAQVFACKDLGLDERRVLEVRMRRIHQALEQLVQKKVDPTQVFASGIGFSGGGMRAALCSYALLKGFEEIGLLDILSHVVGVSGSTWVISDWIAHGKTLREYHDDLFSTLSSKPEISTHSITGALWPKYLFRQGISPTDIFGIYLACRFLNHVPNEQDRVHVKFSHLQDRLRDGNWPVPIATAVEADHDNHWVEFNPFEVSSRELGFSIPIWALGRIFENGTTKDFSPELDLGFLFGTWGAAFAGNFQEILKVYAPHMNPILYSELERFMQSTGIGRIRPCALRIKNPLYHLHEVPDYKFQNHEVPDYVRSLQELTFMDSGYSSNIPLVTLVRPERNLKLIFVLDVSEDIHKGATALKKAEEYIRSKGIPFPKIDYDGILNQPINIFSDPEKPEMPTLIYIVPVKAPVFMGNQGEEPFDPEKEFNTTYKTTHMTYSPQACDRLERFIEWLVIQNKQQLYDAVQQRLKI